MHKPYKRIAEHADKAILFIHGIVGTPNHFAPFLKLAPPNMSIHNILLDGHGKDVLDFAQTSMKKWEAQVALAVEELAEDHNEIYIVAHSLGTLLAIEQAVKNPKITKLFLLAVPLKLFLKPKMFTQSVKVYLNKIDPNDPALTAAKNCYGIAQDRNLLHYLGWAPRFLELFSKIRETRKRLKDIPIPCVAYQSVKDEMVACSCGKLLTRNPNITVVQLKNSGHFYYAGEDLSILMDAFAAFLS